MKDDTTEPLDYIGETYLGYCKAGLSKNEALQLTYLHIQYVTSQVVAPPTNLPADVEKLEIPDHPIPVSHLVDQLREENLRLREENKEILREAGLR